MATSTSIRSAWATGIFANSSITAMTDKIYNFEVLELSTKETARLRFEQEINFFIYLTTRAQRIRAMGQIEQVFTVEVRRYLEADVAGLNYTKLIDNFETLDALVLSGLTSTWSNTVDFYKTQDGPPEVRLEEIEGVKVWLLTYKYFGFKNI